MKKLFILSAAALLLMLSPVRADDVDLRSYNIMLVMTYDHNCAKLRESLMYGIALELGDLPNSLLGPAAVKIHDQLERLGAIEFCARAKPAIDRAVAASAN